MIQIKNNSLLQQALTHSSYAHEHKCQSYERLEFLGDAILETVISDFLYQKFPEDNEGLLTRKRAALVCAEHLAGCAQRLGLGEKVRLGRGMPEEFRKNKSLLCDVMEAVIGAIYLDAGLDYIRKFILKNIVGDYEQETLKDYKTKLQEKYPLFQISYDTTEQNEGFVAIVKINGNIIGTGTGHTKKEAQQQAAEEALKTVS